MNYEKENPSLSVHPTCQHKKNRRNPENGGIAYETVNHKHWPLIYAWKRRTWLYTRRGCRIIGLRKHAKNGDRDKDRLSMHENATGTATQDGDGRGKKLGKQRKSHML